MLPLVFSGPDGYGLESAVRNEAAFLIVSLGWSEYVKVCSQTEE